MLHVMVYFFFVELWLCCVMVKLNRRKTRIIFGDCLVILTSQIRKKCFNLLLIWPTCAFCAAAYNAKTADYSCASDFKWTNMSPKLIDGQLLRRYSQVATDTAMNDFNSGQFKVRMKEIAAQVNFYMYPNAFLSSELFGAWKLAPIYQKCITYLMNGGHEYREYYLLIDSFI